MQWFSFKSDVKVSSKKEHLVKKAIAKEKKL